MLDFIKNVWIGIFIFFIFNFMAIPIYKYKKPYLKYINSIQQLPQQRVDAEILYSQYVEDNGQLAKEEFIKRQQSYRKNQLPPAQTEPKIRRPYYIRDDKDPNILHPYTGN